RDRTPDRPQDHKARPDGHRRRARVREGGRDGDVPRDQLAAGPARPPRRPRARGEGGGRENRRLLRRAPDRRTRLRRARDRAGAARVADARRRPQHAHVAADPQVAEAAAPMSGPEVDFRADGAAALEWAASYLERIHELPVLAQVAPGELTAKLPAAPPERGEPFAAVLADLDELIVPALTNWQHPRFFAYFANTGAEPGILAELLAAT